MPATSAAAGVAARWPLSAARKSARGSAYSRAGVTARTVSVRGRSCRSAYSSKNPPASRGAPALRLDDEVADVDDVEAVADVALADHAVAGRGGDLDERAGDVLVRRERERREH